MGRKKKVADGKGGSQSKATPSISDVLAEFLDEQAQRYKPATINKYANVLSLLEHCIDQYGHNGLSPQREKKIDTLEKEGWRLCELLGPEHIVPNFSEFLGYFMPRKVSPSKELAQAANTVTRKLEAWLVEKGYIPAPEKPPKQRSTGKKKKGAGTKKQAKSRGDGLVTATEFKSALEQAIEQEPPCGTLIDILSDVFTIVTVDEKSLTVKSLQTDQRITLECPSTVTDKACEDMSISGVISRVRDEARIYYVITDVWTVYP